MDKKSSIERHERINAAIVQVFLILISITMLVPFIWMILTSFKTVTEATQVNPFVIFSKVWRTDAFKSVMENMNFILLYKNTLLMIVFRVLCAVVTATTAGYAFARLNFKGKNFAFSLVWPMIVNKDKNLLVLSSALAQMQGQYVTKFPELMAASLIACVPMIIIFLIFQKQFIQGIATSGGKL